MKSIQIIEGTNIVIVDYLGYDRLYKFWGKVELTSLIFGLLIILATFIHLNNFVGFIINPVLSNGLIMIAAIIMHIFVFYYNRNNVSLVFKAPLKNHVYQIVSNNTSLIEADKYFNNIGFKKYIFKSDELKTEWLLKYA